MPMSRENMPMTLLKGLPNAMRFSEVGGQTGGSASGAIIPADLQKEKL
jgi:hypothetical protein